MQFSSLCVHPLPILCSSSTLCLLTLSILCAHHLLSFRPLLVHPLPNVSTPCTLYLLFMAIFYLLCVNYLPSLCPCFTLSLSTLYLLCAHSLLFVSQLLHMPSTGKTNELTFTLCVSTLYTFCVHLLLSGFPPSPSFHFFLSNLYLFCVVILNFLCAHTLHGLCPSFTLCLTTLIWLVIFNILYIRPVPCAPTLYLACAHLSLIVWSVSTLYLFCAHSFLPVCPLSTLFVHSHAIISEYVQYTYSPPKICNNNQSCSTMCGPIYCTLL